MRRVRVAWLTALMLVATTLPGSAWAAQSRHIKSRPTIKVTVATQSRTRDKDKSGKVRIVPINELWDGSSTRTARTTSGPILLDALLSGQVAGRISLPSPVLTAVGAETGRDDFSQTPWLIGHYAHAPPLPL
jgi:hypothetical protein